MPSANVRRASSPSTCPPFVGQKRRGILGGIVATLGTISPSLVIILLVAIALQNFSELTVVRDAFAGIRVCVSVLIFNAAYKLRKKAVVDVWTWIIFFLVLLASLFHRPQPRDFRSGSRCFRHCDQDLGGEKEMILLSLFWEFFKTGLFSIGGGLATLPFLYDMAERTGWFTSADVTNMLAVSESTPGAIGINMSTFAGYTTASVPGALVATLGLVLPSIIIILLVALVLRSFQDNCYVGRALYALRGASNGLITAAGCNVFAVVMLNFALSSRDGKAARSAPLAGGNPVSFDCGPLQFHQADEESAPGRVHRLFRRRGDRVSFRRSLRMRPSTGKRIRKTERGSPLRRPRSVMLFP